MREGDEVTSRKNSWELSQAAERWMIEPVTAKERVEIDLHEYAVPQAMEVFVVFYNEHMSHVPELVVNHGYHSDAIRRELRSFLREVQSRGYLTYSEGEADEISNPGITYVHPLKTIKYPLKTQKKPQPAVNRERPHSAHKPKFRQESEGQTISDDEGLLSKLQEIRMKCRE